MGNGFLSPYKALAFYMCRPQLRAARPPCRDSVPTNSTVCQTADKTDHESKHSLCRGHTHRGDLTEEQSVLEENGGSAVSTTKSTGCVTATASVSKHDMHF